MVNHPVSKCCQCTVATLGLLVVFATGRAAAQNAPSGAQNAPSGAQSSPAGARDAPAGARDAPAETEKKKKPKPEPDAVVTDRPDMAESSETVGRGRFQVETGVDVETRRGNGLRTTSLRTPIKLRLGVAERVEMSLETPGFAFDHVDGPGDRDSKSVGGADLGLGFKVNFCKQKRAVPSTAVSMAVDFPVGSRKFTNDARFYRVTVIAEWGLPQAFGISVNLGATIPISERSAHADTGRYSLTIGRTWAPLYDRLRTSVEFFGETAFEDGETEPFMGGGFVWLVHRRVQLDINVRGQLTRSSAAIGGGVGLGFKI
jgi:hypothetical protein